MYINKLREDIKKYIASHEGMSMAELARQCGVSSDTVRFIVNNRVQDPSYSVVNAIQNKIYSNNNERLFGESSDVHKGFSESGASGAIDYPVLVKEAAEMVEDFLKGKDAGNINKPQFIEDVFKILLDAKVRSFEPKITDVWLSLLAEKAGLE